MNVFEDITTSTGESYKIAQSKTYSLEDIANYLNACMSEPQRDTKISFEIRDDGEIHIQTFNDSLAGEIDATFTAIDD